MFSKVCLSKNLLNIPRFSRFLRHNLLRNHLQRCSTTAAIPLPRLNRSNEANFIAQFVPKYIQDERFILDQSIFKFEENYGDKSKDELVSIFEELTYHCAKMESYITEEKYQPIIEAVKDKISSMSDDEVVKILTDLTRCPSLPARDPKFNEIWETFDNECWERCKHWKWPQLLKVMNVFYKLGINKNSHFAHKSLMKLSRRLDILPPRILVEMMFYQSIIRHKDVPMYNVETRFSRVFNDLTIDEVGIICLAFFKTESKILDTQLISRIYEKVLDELDEIKDITFASILKILRYSSKPAHANYMSDLFDKLIPIVDKFSTLACLHIALLGTNIQNCNTKLIEKIVARFNNEISSVRIKDIDRISLVLALYDLKTESGIEQEFMQNILKELHTRVNEITQFPRCFTSTIHYLSMKGAYDVELIKAALTEKFVVFAYGKNHFNYSHEVLCLDSFSRINLKDTYDGPQLSEKIRKGIATYSSHYIPFRNQPHKLTYGDKLLLDVQELAEVMYGTNKLTQVLPHFERPDVIYCFDENGKSVTPEIIDLFSPRKIHPGIIFSKEYLLSQRQPFADNINKYKMIAIVVGGWNFYLRDTKIPTGVLRMKIDQLKMIGYHPIVIHWMDWTNKSLQCREEILSTKLNEVLDN